jgi:hypothetical protein
MKNRGVFTLTIGIFGGAAAIYAVLFVLALLPQFHAETVLPLFIPLSLLWAAACISWVILRRSRTAAGGRK